MVPFFPRVALDIWCHSVKVPGNALEVAAREQGGSRTDIERTRFLSFGGG